MQRWRIATVAAALALGVAACGADDDGGAVSAEQEQGSSSASGGEEAAHNDADVEFAQMMIPHHEGALEMAEMALEKAESPEVKDLAERIEAAQGPEIETLRQWLEEWGEDAEADGDMGGMDHGGSGMMSSEEMDELESLEGAEFDQQFLTMMKEHHEGAVEMAETELEDGEYPPALELAQQIIDAQEAEIEEMDQLLSES